MKKGSFKYYLSTFAMVFVFVLLLTVLAHSQGTYFISASLTPTGNMAKEITIFLYKNKTFILGNYLFDLIAIFSFPIVFTLLFMLIDFLTGKLRSKKKKAQDLETEKYNNFIDDISAELNKTKLFNIEDFRHFRENEKFQECLKKLYKIYDEGESEACNYHLVLRKFDKGTKEKEAIEYLVTYTERRRKNKIEKEEAKKEGVNE